MAKWKSLLDWCKREFEEATKYFVRVPEEHYLAINMIETLCDARNKEIAKKALDICQHWIELEPTTPLRGCDSEWELMEASQDTKIYINKRYSPLFKIVKKQGFEEKITYTDRNRVKFDGDEDYIPFLREKIDELIPITFPYIPEKIGIEARIIRSRNGRLYFGFHDFSRNGGKPISLDRYFCYDSSLGGKSWEVSKDKIFEVMDDLGWVFPH